VDNTIHCLTNTRKTMMFMKSHVLLAFIRLELDDIITFCNKIKKKISQRNAIRIV